MTNHLKEKILVIGPSWVGDMVMAQTLYIRLKQHHPDCEIVVMAPEWTKPVLERMPEVTKTLALPLEHGEIGLGKRRQLGLSLRDQGYTTAIVLPNSFKSALIPFFAKIPNRIGWRGEWRVPLLTDCRVLDKEKFPLMVQRFAGLAESKSAPPLLTIESPKLQVDTNTLNGNLEKFELNRQGHIIAICPGAEFGDAKQWPASHFAEFCSEQLAQGYQVWLFGSKNDAAIATEIESMIKPDLTSSFRNLAGLTNLAEAIDLLSLADVCVSNDSGLMHVAAALGLPVVSIYGSTSPDFTPPLTDKVKLLTTDIECRPCFQRKCPLGHLRCLKDISPGQVSESASQLMKPA